MHFLDLTLGIRFEPVLGGLGQFLYMHFLDLTLGIRFEPVLGGLSRLKEIASHTSMQMVRSNKNNFIYSNSMKTNRNELIRRLLSGITNDALQNLVRVREEARRPIPTPRKKNSYSCPTKNGGQAINPLF